MGEFQLQRIGVVMEPEPGNPWEVEGVLNPASARGPDGQLILFPRLVAKGNYSRIGVARVLFDTAGDPKGEGSALAAGWSTRQETAPDSVLLADVVPRRAMVVFGHGKPVSHTSSIR